MGGYFLKSDDSNFSIVIMTTYFNQDGYVFYKTESRDMNTFRIYGGTCIRDICAVEQVNLYLYSLLIKNIDIVSTINNIFNEKKKLLFVNKEDFDKYILPYLLLHIGECCV